MNRTFLKLLAITLIMFTLFSACGSTPVSRLETARQQDMPIYSLGEGRTTFRFEKIDLEGNGIAWDIHTNASTVGAALLNLGLISGEDDPFGLFITEVNGLHADFASSGTWWAFVIDGEMAMTGVGETDIVPGQTYAFVLTAD